MKLRRMDWDGACGMCGGEEKCIQGFSGETLRKQAYRVSQF
jgi:hypothetical protein